MRSAISEDGAAVQGFRIPMRGYEIEGWIEREYEIRFRIPMRGYEATSNATPPPCSSVPNPHEGL